MAHCKRPSHVTDAPHPHYRRYEKLQRPDIDEISAKRRFKDQPGLIDPFVVVQACIPVLQRSVHMAVQTSQDKVKNYCDGIKLYLEKWKPAQDVEKAVDAYIKFPCMMDMNACIAGDNRRAFQFLYIFLQRRGPMIDWVVHTDNAETLFRCIRTVLSGQLNMLTESEFTTFVTIGRHLNHLVAIGYAHKLYYLRDLVAKVWGPIFIHLCHRESEMDRTPEADVDKVIRMFSVLIETAPWHTYSPYEAVSTAMRQTVSSPFTRYQEDQEHRELRDLRIPDSVAGSISDCLRSRAVELAKCTVSLCPVHYFRFDQRPADGLKNPPENREDIFFPPDDCRIK